MHTPLYLAREHKHMRANTKHIQVRTHRTKNLIDSVDLALHVPRHSCISPTNRIRWLASPNQAMEAIGSVYKRREVCKRREGGMRKGGEGGLEGGEGGRGRKRERECAQQNTHALGDERGVPAGEAWSEARVSAWAPATACVAGGSVCSCPCGPPSLKPWSPRAALYDGVGGGPIAGRRRMCSEVCVCVCACFLSRWFVHA